MHPKPINTPPIHVTQTSFPSQDLALDLLTFRLPNPTSSCRSRSSSSPIPLPSTSSNHICRIKSLALFLLSSLPKPLSCSTSTRARLPSATTPSFLSGDRFHDILSPNVDPFLVNPCLGVSVTVVVQPRSRRRARASAVGSPNRRALINSREIR